MQNFSAQKAADRIGKAKSTFHGYVTEGLMPKGKKNGLSVYWPSNVIEAWIILSEGSRGTLPAIAVDDLNEIMACVQRIEELKNEVA